MQWWKQAERGGGGLLDFFFMGVSGSRSGGLKLTFLLTAENARDSWNYTSGTTEIQKAVPGLALLPEMLIAERRTMNGATELAIRGGEKGGCC